MRRTGRLSLMSSLLVMASGLVVGVRTSTAHTTTYTVTDTNLCGGSGSFRTLLAEANANPGPDTIEFTPGLRVAAWTCNTLTPPIFGYPLTATGSIDIVGNGATIAGDQIYLTSAGVANDPTSCPSRTAGTVTVEPSVGFLEVGTFNVDNTGIAVTVHNLDFSGMPSLFLVEKNASLSLTDSTAARTMSFNDDCSRPPIDSSNGNVTLTHVVFRESSTPAPPRG